MKTTKIKAFENLYNHGKCFTEGKIYEVQGIVENTACLMGKMVINDLGNPHVIGNWWKYFEIVELKPFKTILIEKICTATKIKCNPSQFAFLQSLSITQLTFLCEKYAVQFK